MTAVAETLFHHTGGVVQSGGEICRHGEGAGTEEDAAGGIAAGHLQPHDPQLPRLQCLHTGGQRTGKQCTHARLLGALYILHIHTHKVSKWSAVLMKGCNKFEEASVV